jgi:hypothetical protein
MSFTNGKVGQAFQFDGTTGYVSIPASSSLDVGSGAGFTIEGWINPTSISSNQPLVEWNASNDDVGVGVHLWISVPVPGAGPGSLFANLKNPANNFILNTGPGLVTNGVFQHVALTYDKPSGIATLYYNGALVAQALSPVPNYTPATTANLYFGKRIAESPTTIGAAGTVFGGLMDEISLYKTALSAAQIQAIYNAGTAGKCLSRTPPVITLEPISQSVRPGCSVTFNSAATGSGVLTYQWQFNGTNLPAANGANLTVLNVQPADFGNYAMIASNAGGSATSTVAVLALGHLPVPGSIVIQRFPHFGVRMNTGEILAAASDADGYPLSLLGVATNSAAGGRVTLDGHSIYYMPPRGFTNADSFNYTIGDGHCGGTVVGTVLVKVRGDSNPACCVTMFPAGDGSMQVIFDGMPGVAYRVQTADTLSPPDWQDVTTIVASQYGTCIYMDWPATNGPARYFRSVSP